MMNMELAKRRAFTSLGFSIVAFLSSASLAQDRHEKYAVLVAVNSYEDSNMNRSPLKFPEDDARALGMVLKSSGYHVVLLLGKAATKPEIEKALELAGKQGTENGAVLLGFFGHGVQYGQRGFFCPYDTRLRIVKDSKGQTIRGKNGNPRLEPNPISLTSMRKMLDTLSVSGATNRILIADCCRDDPNRARGRTAFGSTLDLKDLPLGTAVMFACSKGEQAFEHDDWKHGAFTYALLKHATSLSKSGTVTAGTLSDRVYETVKKIVAEKTGEPKQTVYSLTSGRIDFLLKPRPVRNIPAEKYSADLAVKSKTNSEAKKTVEGNLISDTYFAFQKSAEPGGTVQVLPLFKYRSVRDLGVLINNELLDVEETEVDLKVKLPNGIRPRLLSFKLPRGISQTRAKFVFVNRGEKYELTAGKFLEIKK